MKFSSSSILILHSVLHFCTFSLTILLLSGCVSQSGVSGSQPPVAEPTVAASPPPPDHKQVGGSLKSEEADWYKLEPARASRPGVANPGVANPGVANPGVANLGVASPGVANPGVASHGDPAQVNLSALELSNLKRLNQKLYTVNAVQLAAGPLLYSLAKESKLEMLIRGEQSLPVTVRLENRPLAFILNNIASQANLRWQFIDGVIDISPDSPYLRIYDVDYLNITRLAKGSVGLATQVGSIALDVEGEGAGNGFTNNSQVLIENESRHQFWESIEADLSQVMSSKLNTGQSLSVNRDVGLVSLKATHADHQAVAEYLHKLQRIATRQVLIEAIVVEVSLSDQFQAGIDWRAEGPGLGMAQVFHGRPEVSNGVATKLPATAALVSAIHNSKSLGRISATLDLLNEFGKVKILSRPQIIAINNQSAVLKVVDNRVYFTMTVERHTKEGEEDIRTATEIHTVPVGLVMNVTPYIGKNKNVILSVRPTISRILGFVNDPNPELAHAKVQNGVPEIQIREMESVLRVANGDIVMIGGLMQDQRNDSHQNIPWLSDLPLIGAAFKRRKESSKKTELLVFLQPTVMDAM